MARTKPRDLNSTTRRIDVEALGIELLQALRGRRTKPGFSKMLGYKSNIAQRWEAGVCWPSAERFFFIVQRCGVNLSGGLRQFLGREPEWMSSASLDSRAGVAQLLLELKGAAPLQAIAKRSGYGRFSVSRWLNAKASPKLPELLKLVEACSGRLIDFVGTVASPERLPSVSGEWRQLEAARALAYENPMAHAVLRGLELENGRAGRDVDWLAKHLGLSAAEVRQDIETLIDLKLARRVRGEYKSQEDGVVNTGTSPQLSRRLRLAWTEIALQRLQSGSPGSFGYSLFAASRETMLELREIHAAYVRQMSTAIASSQHNECVGLYCSQLLDLADREHNVFRKG